MTDFLLAMMLTTFFYCPFTISSFVLTSCVKRMSSQRWIQAAFAIDKTRTSINQNDEIVTWSPQDLTMDEHGFKPIPQDDYVKQYQRYPSLWPVEFFVIVYRRTASGETQILVRSSANGTSKWGLGTGVPATRWVLATANPPPGYAVTEPPLFFEADNFPEFPPNTPSWTYQKIDIQNDAFSGPNTLKELRDPELEEYANNIRKLLRKKLSEQIDKCKDENSWEGIRLAVVKQIVDKPSSLAAIQGTLRMSGVFAYKENNDSSCRRYINFGINAPDPVQLVESMRIYTMFPQMPDPMPLPSTSAKQLQEELETRDAQMLETGRSPHKDVHGRMYTHKSTSNVSNTIHGIYLTLDVTNWLQEGDATPPALDLFGTQRVKREWKSLQDLCVFESEDTISTKDTKPTFISGFIVRQLIREGVIQIQGNS